VACTHAHRDLDAYVRRPSTRKLLYSNARRTGADDESRCGTGVMRPSPGSCSHAPASRCATAASCCCCCWCDASSCLAIWRPSDDTAYPSRVAAWSCRQRRSLASRAEWFSEVTQRPTTRSRRRVDVCARVHARASRLDHCYFIIIIQMSRPCTKHDSTASVWFFTRVVLL